MTEEGQKLPEMEVDTGEKDEKEIWKQRCILYRYAPNKEPPEWVTRGIGDIRFLQNDSTRKVRLVLRENKIFKLRLNHIVHPDIGLSPKQGVEDKAWTWSALDYAEEDGTSREELFCVKFKTTEFAQEFKKQFDEARAINAGKKASSTRSETSAPSKMETPNRSREIKLTALPPTPISPSFTSATDRPVSNDLQSYEQRALLAEKLLATLNSRLAEVEHQLGLASIAEKKNQPPLRLGYWAIRGLAQPIRLLLTYLNVPFTERRYVAKGKDREDWNKEKYTLGLPFPNLPYLCDGDIKVTQSHAIVQYIVRSYGPYLSGSNTSHQGEVDMIIGVLYDIRDQFVRLCYSEKYNQLVTQYQNETLPGTLKQLSEYLESKGNLYFTGSRLTVADFIAYEVLDCNRLMTPKAFESHPNLNDFITRFEHLPQISAYLKSKDYINRPINNPTALFR